MRAMEWATDDADAYANAQALRLVTQPAGVCHCAACRLPGIVRDDREVSGHTQPKYHVRKDLCVRKNHSGTRRTPR